MIISVIDTSYVSLVTRTSLTHTGKDVLCIDMDKNKNNTNASVNFF